MGKGRRDRPGPGFTASGGELRASKLCQPPWLRPESSFLQKHSKCGKRKYERAPVAEISLEPGSTASGKSLEAPTSSGVSFASGCVAAARRARFPARMLLRLICLSGGGPPRGCPRTMMAHPERTYGGEEREKISGLE